MFQRPTVVQQVVVVKAIASRPDGGLANLLIQEVSRRTTGRHCLMSVIEPSARIRELLGMVLAGKNCCCDW